MAIIGGRNSKLNLNVLNEKDCNGDIISTWCRAGSKQEEAFCTICNTTINCRNHGSSAVKRHATNCGHITACKKNRDKDGVLKSLQRPLQFNKPSSCRSHTDNVIAAELEFTVALAVENIPYSFSDTTTKLFSKMFSDSQIAKDYKCCRVKSSYLISDGIGPYLREQLLKDMRDSAVFYSIQVDETPIPEKRVQQMDVLARFFSEKYQQVTVQHLQSFHIGHGTANTMFDCLNEVLVELPKDKLLSFYSDGPNVMISLKNKIKVLYPQLLDISTCSLHKVHNGFSKALDVFGGDVETFLIDLYYFFKHSAAQSEDLKILQSELGIEERVLLRHVSSRWLTLDSSLKRFLDMHNVIIDFFKKSTTTRDSIRFKRINAALQDKLLLAKALFLKNISDVLNKYVGLFQTEAPLIHILYDEMVTLIKTLMGRFLISSCYQELSGRKLVSLNLDDSKIWKKSFDIEIGVDIKTLSTLHASDKKDLYLGARSFYLACTKYLLKSFPLDNKFLQHLQVLHPLMRTETDSPKSIKYIACMIPNVIKEDEISIITDEWLRLQTEPLVSDEGVNDPYIRIDDYWRSIFNIKDNMGNLKYPLLAVLIKALLSLPHGNADVERSFSLNKRMLTNRSNLNICSINGLRQIKSYVKQLGGLEKFSVTNEMLKCSKNSYRNYTNRMERENNAACKRKVDQETVCKEKDLKSEEVLLKQKLKTSEQMYELATKNLEDGINKNNMILIQSGHLLQKEAKSKMDIYVKELAQNKKEQDACLAMSKKIKK